MPWFRPRSLLDKTYEIGLLIKGIDGAAELLGGLLLLVVNPQTITHLTTLLTHDQLDEDPHDFIATHILHLGNSLARGHNGFAIAFLLTHGLIKVALVVCLLMGKLWAYPFALVTLSLFVVYQAYEMIIHPTFGMAFLTILDIFIIWLVWREWQKVKAAGPSPSAAE